MSGKEGTHPETARRPSGEMSALRTQDVCPVSVATAPDPGFPEAVERTSCKMSRLSSDAVSSNCEIYQLNQHRTRESNKADLSITGPRKRADSHGM